jgi:tetratricopeptide (TPR) repeat protein
MAFGRIFFCRYYNFNLDFCKKKLGQIPYGRKVLYNYTNGGIMSKQARKALITTILAASFTMGHLAYSYSPPFLSDDNYQKGIISLTSNNYSDAILELSAAIAKYPDVPEIKSNLSDAYYRRGADYSSAGEYKKAANDLRAAIFYLKYYQDPTAIELQKASISESTLRSCLEDCNIATDAKSRFNEGKKLRGQGLFPQAIVEFIEAAKDPSVRGLALENAGDLFVLLNKSKNAIICYQDALVISPLNYEMHLKLARALEKEGITDKAIEEYNLAFGDNENADEIMPALERLANLNLTKFPDSSASYLNMGAVCQRKGDYANALTYYQKAQDLDRSNPIIKINIGSLYQAQGDCLKAISVYDSVIADFPKDKLAYTYKARAYDKMKNYSEAINTYQQVLKLDPKDQQAKEEMLDVIGNDLPNEQAWATFETLIAAFPSDDDILKAYADSLLKKKIYYKAVAQYQKLISKDSSDIQSYIGQAQAYQGLNDIDNALKTIDDAIAQNPDDKKLPAFKVDLLANKDDVLFNQAFDLYQKGNIVKALDTYKLIQNPNTDTFVNIGACYQRLGKYPEAMDSYNKALAIEPDNADVLSYIGNVSCLQGQFDKALIYYQKAIVIDPNNKAVQEEMNVAKKQQAEVLFNQGMTAYKALDYKKALKIFGVLLARDSKNSYGYYYRALCYDALNDPRKAIEDYIKVKTLTPNMELVYYSLGVDYDTISDFKNAKEAYRKFIELSGTKNTEYTKYAKKRIIDLKNVK